MTKANLRPLTDLVGNNLRLVYRYRRGAAFIAVAFPAAAAVVFAAILLDKGPASFLQFLFSTKFGGPSNVVGFGALIVWIIRYSIPGVRVILKQGNAVHVDDGTVHFFGKAFPQSQIDGYAIHRSLFRKDLQLVANGAVVATGSEIFVRVAENNWLLR